jgi:hypothetical protein
MEGHGVSRRAFREEGDLLFDAVLEHLEVRPPEPANQQSVLTCDNHWQTHEIDAVDKGSTLFLREHC